MHIIYMLYICSSNPRLDPQGRCAAVSVRRGRCGGFSDSTPSSVAVPLCLKKHSFFATFVAKVATWFFPFWPKLGKNEYMY